MGRCSGFDWGGLSGGFDFWVIECMRDILVPIGSLMFNKMFDPFCDGMVSGCIL